MSCDRDDTQPGMYVDHPIDIYNITSQNDIDNGTLLHYKPNGDLIRVHGAKGALNFTNLTSFYQMNIFCNHELQNVFFPHLTSFVSLDIYDAPALRNISMGQSNTEATYLTIKHAPQLGQISQNGWSPPEFHGVSFYSVDLDDAGSASFPDSTSAQDIDVVNTFVDFPLLETVSMFLRMTNPQKGWNFFPSLKNVSNIYIGNGSIYDSFGISAEGRGSTTPDLVVERSVVMGPHSSTGEEQMVVVQGGFRLNNLVKVGQDLNITRNSGMTYLSFDQLTDVKRLYIMDNPNSTISADFSRLTTASSIHINGMIDTTINPALFPLLSRAGEVEIEAWNQEFDCSRLVQMRDKGIIGFLSCNGTNGTNEGKGAGPDSSPPSSASHTGLSTAASAGIGTGVGVAALGIIAVLAWFILHYRRKLKGVEKESRNNGRDDPKEATREAAKPRETQLDDTEVREAGGRSLPCQSGGGEILEAGGRALRAEAENERVADDAGVASPQEKKTSPVELA
ncbi:hypothetical protein PG993_013115 [Apiospora rasikravindrae]|uniref:Uncharacterized protein n=1 Tax=Apiospora rasikravindrae TaxID=990691 RepID=A0ABR1RWV4_9PEZI